MSEPKRILIVEDDPDIRRVTRATLEGAGHAITEAENGLEGIERIRESKPDLVVLDVMMPEMNGAEFCRALVDDLKLPEVPVLILSSINEKSGLMKSLASVNLERREFLKKPVGPVELKFRVAQMLGLERTPPKAPAKEPTPSPAPKPQPGGRRSGEPGRVSLAPRRSSEPAASMEGPSEVPRCRVLIVDDDRDLLAVNKFTLSKDHDVATAENGLDGLEVLDLFKPDFVLVDYNMPSMDGLEMVELMRRHPHFHNTPALFLTGNEERNLPRRAHEAGINLFLRKPIEPERLRRSVAHFIRESGLKPKGAGGAETPSAAPAPPAPSSEPPPAKMAPPPSRPASSEGGAKARLRPRTDAPTGPQKPQPAAPPRATSSGSKELVRVLIVDYNESTAERLLQLIERGLSGRVHHHHVTDHREALANLARWEPDIILYNPRDPGLDGIAFFQLFKIKRINLDVEFAFTGIEFVNAELKYSRQSFGREVINLKDPEGKILYELQSMVERAERKPRKKRHTIEEIREEDNREKAQQAKEAEREAKQREAERRRFRQIQDIIDRDR